MQSDLIYSKTVLIFFYNTIGYSQTIGIDCLRCAIKSSLFVSETVHSILSSTP